MSVEKFIHYLRYEKNYSSHTVFAYEKDLRQFFQYVAVEFQIEQPSQIDTDCIRSWMVSLMEKGLTPRSVSRKLSTLKSYWRYLLRIGQVAKNPLHGLVAPKIRKTLPSFLKEADLEALSDLEQSMMPDDDAGSRSIFEAVRNRLILEMLVQTGMRRAELIGLHLADVDTSAGLLRVTGKRNKQRLIPFGASLKGLIEDYLKLRSQRIQGAPNANEAFFVREDGQELYPSLVYRLVRDSLSQVGTLSKNSPHVLRHTFASSMLNNGAELNAVKELLGHANLSATEVYTHTTFEQLKQVYKQAHPRAD